ncbi:GNAT family N-acetyltransferase [Embleya sp. NBC_00888]|uniref:GNAT family N-acetyltransferase n=1 Tax=Embleya sp. NBC_00888 TaxID=2975960 RepID=UPI00386BD6CF|nr:GNAT family N-acetyltransferase [Embleya sp. NBC_00888]
MREITDHDELLRRCDGDAMCVWTAQGLTGGRRAWADADGAAVVVAGAELCRHDRLAVHGSPEALVPLVREVLSETGPGYRPFGDPERIAALVAGVPELVEVGSFGWMDLIPPTPTPVPDDRRVRWLTEDATDEVVALIESGFPSSYAKPGLPGVERWAGVRDADGTLPAVAALAWSAPSIGFLAGVGVAPAARGRGLGRIVCAFVLAEARGRHGGAALMVDEWNHTAIRMYEGLGMTYRPVKAAAWSGRAG